MKTTFYLLLFLSVLSLSSCKTLQKKHKTHNAKSLIMIQSYNENVFSKNSLQAKLKVYFKSSKTMQNAHIKLRIQKDSIIWMSASVLGFPVAKLKITPGRIQFYEKIKHTYFDGDYSFIRKNLGVDINFFQLQNLLLGQSINALQEEDHLQKDGQFYKITPRQQDVAYQLFYWLNPGNYKLDKQLIKRKTTSEELQVKYPSYTFINHIFFPESIEITAKNSKQTTFINVQYKQVTFDNPLDFPFTIPKGYKRISL